MELNTRGRYAVMAMADIAERHLDDASARAVPLSEIAERQQLPLTYLEQLFGKLRVAGLVESVRGRSGGYRLARPAAAIAIADIMAAAEEPTRMTRCLGVDDAGCVAERRCLTHGLWSALGRHIHDFMARVTLADVVGEGALARGRHDLGADGLDATGIGGRTIAASSEAARS